MTQDRALRLRSLARYVEQLELVTVVRASTTDTWTGPTASAVTDALHHQRVVLLQAVDHLRTAARRIEQSGAQGFG